MSITAVKMPSSILGFEPRVRGIRHNLSPTPSARFRHELRGCSQGARAVTSWEAQEDKCVKLLTHNLILLAASKCTQRMGLQHLQPKLLGASTRNFSNYCRGLQCPHLPHAVCLKFGISHESLSCMTTFGK